MSGYRDVKSPRMITTYLKHHHIDVMKQLLNLKKEVGGGIFLNKQGQVDFMSVYTGRESHVIIPDAFEIEFHTHPLSSFVELPSVRDLKTAMNRKLRIGDFRGELQMIVGRNGITVYKFTGKKKLKEKHFDEIENVLQRGFDTSIEGLRRQIEQINIFPFELKLISWEEIERNRKKNLRGIPLKLCFRKYMVDP